MVITLCARIPGRASSPKQTMRSPTHLADLIAETLQGEEKLLIDAFCGAGFFTKRLAPQFERVVGIDWDRFAIAAAQKDAAPNEAYIAGDVTTELRWLLQQSDLASTALIVDPPATGLSAEMRRAILDAPPRTHDLRLLQSANARRATSRNCRNNSPSFRSRLSTCSLRRPRSKW